MYFDLLCQSPAWHKFHVLTCPSTIDDLTNSQFTSNIKAVNRVLNGLSKGLEKAKAKFILKWSFINLHKDCLMRLPSMVGSYDSKHSNRVIHFSVPWSCVTQCTITLWINIWCATKETVLQCDQEDLIILIRYSGPVPRRASKRY